MLVSTVGLAFAQTENWVEVATFSEGRARFGDTNSFVIDHEEWRLVWEYEVDLEMLTAFMFDVKEFIETHFSAWPRIQYLMSF